MAGTIPSKTIVSRMEKRKIHCFLAYYQFSHRSPSQDAILTVNNTLEPKMKSIVIASVVVEFDSQLVVLRTISIEPIGYLDWDIFCRKSQYGLLYFERWFVVSNLVFTVPVCDDDGSVGLSVASTKQPNIFPFTSPRGREFQLVWVTMLIW